MRMQYDTEEKFAAFLKKVEDKKRKNERLHRFDIVFIPENLRTFLPPGTPMEFSADTVYGFLAMKPMEAVPRIAPRPLLIIHAKDDHVVPVEDARALGYESLKLDTLPAMKAAQRLYEDLGFRDTAPYNDNSVAGVRFMALDLTR